MSIGNAFAIEVLNTFPWTLGSKPCSSNCCFKSRVTRRLMSWKKWNASIHTDTPWNVLHSLVLFLSLFFWFVLTVNPLSCRRASIWPSKTKWRWRFTLADFWASRACLPPLLSHDWRSHVFFSFSTSALDGLFDSRLRRTAPETKCNLVYNLGQ